jgi:hypothetical protein
MKRTPSGINVGGQGGTGVKVNNVVIVPGPGGTASATDTRAIYRSPNAETYACDFDGSNATKLSTRTTQITVAGPTVWGCWEGPQPHQRTFTSFTADGNEIDNAWAPLAAGRDDALLLGHRATGVGLRCYGVAGDVLWEDLSAVICFRTLPQAFMLDAARCIWADPAGKLYTRGLPTPQQLGPAYDPFILVAPDGEYWVGYHNTDCRIHPIGDASRGYILDTGLTYGTTANETSVAWSRDEAEGQMESVVVDWSKPLVSLTPEAPRVHVPPFSRDCLLADYHATRHGMSVRSAGHVEIVTDGQDAGTRAMKGRKVIADMKSEKSVPDGQLYALFVVYGVDDMAQAKKVADRRGVPRMVYHDHITPFPAAALAEMEAGWDFASTKHYCDWNEPVDIFKARSHWQVEQVEGRGFRIILTVQAFDRNGTEKDRVKLMQLTAFWHELFEYHPDVFGLAPFAVIRDSVDLPTQTPIPGKGGIHGQEDLTEWWDAYGAQAVEPPAPTRGIAPPPPPPVVTPPTPPVVPPSPAPGTPAWGSRAAADLVTAVVAQAKADMERVGYRFKTADEASRDNYAHWTYEDRVLSAQANAITAERLAEMFPQEDIGLEYYPGASGVPLPHVLPSDREHDLQPGEPVSFDIVLFGRTSGLSADVLAAGVNPTCQWHQYTDPADIQASAAAWRRPVVGITARILAAGSQPPVVPPVPPPAPPPPLPPVPPPPGDSPVTPQQIAEVLAGRDFERIATLLNLPGTDVNERRPAVHAWIRDRIVALDSAYQRVFGRGVDLEGAGSRVLLALEGLSDAEIEAVLVKDKENGAG